MVRKRLITVLTINNGVLFRTRNFIPDYRYTLNFVDAWSVDELILLDITRPDQESREHFSDMLKHLSKNCFVPISAGGRVRSINDVKHLLRQGADKVTVNTLVSESPGLVTEAAKMYGSQCMVASMDVKKNNQGDYEVYTHCGTRGTGKHPADWARMAQSLGAGEILVQSIDRDGTLEGYDNELNSIVSDAIDIPVLVCSGAGKWQHFVDAFNHGNASGVCTTNIYHFTEASITSAKKFIGRAGIDIRL